MSISGISPQGFQRVNQLLGEVGKAIDPKSHGKATVTDVEAKKIVQAFDKLTPEEKTEVTKALQAMMQQDVFTVSDKGRATFATALGVDAKNLEPQGPVAGGGQVRSVMKAALQALTRPVQIDKKTFEELKAGLKDAPKPIGDFLVGALRAASEDGGVKFEGEARKDFTKEFAARSGGVDWIANKYGENWAKRMPPIAQSMLSNPPFFEEIIAALMITVVTETNEDVLKEQMKIDDVVKHDQSKTDTLKGAQKDSIVKNLQGDDKLSEAGKTEPVGPSGPQPGGKLANTKGKLEAVVSSIDARMKDGQISLDDAKAIRGKLDRFDKADPVTKLVAEAMGTALQHSGILATKVIAPRLEPIASWVKEVTGKTDFPKPTGISPNRPLSQALMESDKVEQRLAGFLVEAFLERPKASLNLETGARTASAPPKAADGQTAAQTTMEKFKPVLQQVLAEAAPAEVAAQTAPKAAGSDAQLLERFGKLVDAREKMPPGTLEKAIDTTVDRHAGGLDDGTKKMMKDGLRAALNELPKTGNASSDQVQAAFHKCAHKAAVAHVEKKMSPDELEAKAELVGGAVESALQKAYDRVGTTADQGKSVSPAAQQQVLGEEMVKARDGLIKDAKAAGYDDKQIGGLVHAFDAEGRRAMGELEKTGKIQPTKPGGANVDQTDPAQTDDTRSRQLMFEKLKFKMNMLSEIMQAMSNVLNTMHQNAENTIRAIR